MTAVVNGVVGLVMLAVLSRLYARQLLCTLDGQLSSAAAIVFFLGSRLLYGQLGAFVRRHHAPPGQRSGRSW